MELLESALRALRFLLSDFGVSIRLYYPAERLRPSQLGGSRFRAAGRRAFLFRRSRESGNLRAAGEVSPCAVAVPFTRTRYHVLGTLYSAVERGASP